MYVMYRILIYFLCFASAKSSDLDSTIYYDIGDTFEMYCERPTLSSDVVLEWTKLVHKTGYEHTIPTKFTPPKFNYTLTASELDHGSKFYCKGMAKNNTNHFDIIDQNTVTLMQADRAEDAFNNHYEYNDTINIMLNQSIGDIQKQDIDDSYVVESTDSTFQVFVLKYTMEKGLHFTRRINKIPKNTTSTTANRSSSSSYSSAYCVGSVVCLVASILLVTAFLWLRYNRKNRHANDLSNQEVIYAVPDQVTYAELDLENRVSHDRLLPHKIYESPYAQIVGYLSRKRQ